MVDMAYELTNPATGEKMHVLHREWEYLLDLASRYGWEPKDVNYAGGGEISETEAAEMADAITRALPDISGYPGEQVSVGLISEAPPRNEDYLFSYWSGGSRKTLEEFVHLAAGGGFVVNLAPGFSGEF